MCCPVLVSFCPLSSNGEVFGNRPGPVTVEDVQIVHFYIEICIQRKMTKDQTLIALATLGVDTRFTDIVWSQLIEQNPEFFAQYPAGVVSES